MKQAYGHLIAKETMRKIRTDYSRKIPSKKLAYWEWIKTQKEITKLSFARQFLISDITAGVALNKFVAEGKLKLQERGAHDKGVWVVI